MGFVAKVISGQKKAFKRNEIDLLNLKNIPELGWKYLKPEIYAEQEVLDYHDDRFHRAGHPLEGKIILDDYVFTVSIWNKVQPQKCQAWIKKQEAINKLKLDRKNKNMILVDLDWLNKIKEQQKTHHKKGKSGKMITNCQRKEELKRKRIEIEKRQAANEVRQDKVWLPQEDFNEPDTLPIGKEFVPIDK